jgi:hypothetical protein
LENARAIGVDDQDGEDTTLVVARWEFAGLGYLTGGNVARSRCPRRPVPANGARPPATGRTDREEPQLGVPPRVVMEIVGHSTLEMTMRVYGHVSLDAQRDALGQLEDLLDKDED